MLPTEIEFIEKYIFEELPKSIAYRDEIAPTFYVIFKTELYSPFKKFLMSNNVTFNGHNFDSIRRENKSNEILIKFEWLSHGLNIIMFNHTQLTEQLTRFYNIIKIEKNSEFKELNKFVKIINDYAIDKRKVKIDYLLKLNEE